MFGSGRGDESSRMQLPVPSPLMGYRFRQATQGDEQFLVEMLYEALFVPEGQPLFPRSVVDRPDLARYARGFGGWAGDAGWIVEDAGGDRVGAVWVRQFSREAPGYGFVDEATPELSIAVVSERRGQGLGTALMARLLGSVPRCSLSVDNRNRAVRLYERFGFEVVFADRHSLKMLRA